MIAEYQRPSPDAHPSIIISNLLQFRKDHILIQIPFFLALPSSNGGALLTFACASDPYGTFSRAPLNAPSESPPLSSCFICVDNVCTSDADTEGLEGRREETSKLAGDSGSSRSTLIVRQFIVAIIASE